MRKKVFGRKFARNTNSRKALFRSLIWALLDNGQIVTTKSKAKAIVPEVDHLITLAKNGSIAAQRQILAELGNNKKSQENLMKRVPTVGARTSGFTKMTSFSRRLGDGAETVKLEFIDKPEAKKVEEPKPKEEKKAPKKAKVVSSKSQVKSKKVVTDK